jgi:hypothetical protein
VGTGLTGGEHRSDRCATTQSGDFEGEDTRRDHMACVEATQGAVAGHPSDGEDMKTLQEINPLPTPIYGCNMAVLVASGISCIEVRWLINGCNWNGAIA